MGTYPASMLETVKIIAKIEEENTMTHEEKVKQLAFVMTEMFAVHKKGPERVAYLLSELEREGKELRESSLNSNNTKFRMEIIRHFFPEPQPFPKWKTFDVLPDSNISTQIRVIQVVGDDREAIPFLHETEDGEFAIARYGSDRWFCPATSDLWMYEAEFITLIESAF